MSKNEWGEVIQFLGGWCWGITPDGQALCCGREEDVRAILADPNKKSASSAVNAILDLERKLIEEAKGGTRTEGNIRARVVHKRGAVRGRLVRGTKLKGRHSRLSAKGKRLPVRKSVKV